MLKELDREESRFKCLLESVPEILSRENDMISIIDASVTLGQMKEIYRTLEENSYDKEMLHDHMNLIDSTSKIIRQKAKTFRIVDLSY